MKKLLVIFFIFIFSSGAYATIKENIIKNLTNIQNLNFNFEQNINGKIETGNCTIEYPKKIFCNYNLANKKILVSNGKSLVIRTNRSYYRYPIKKTPLKLILDKNFLINEIRNLSERIIDNRYINFTILRDENEINIFFDKKNYNLVGWQILDIYQNLNITYLSSIKKNQILEKNLFKLPNKLN
jgi:outer membrane lipoprotein-sorting protein